MDMIYKKELTCSKMVLERSLKLAQLEKHSHDNYDTTECTHHSILSYESVVEIFSPEKVYFLWT